MDLAQQHPLDLKRAQAIARAAPAAPVQQPAGAAQQWAVVGWLAPLSREGRCFDIVQHPGWKPVYQPVESPTPHHKG